VRHTVKFPGNDTEMCPEYLITLYMRDFLIRLYGTELDEHVSSISLLISDTALECHSNRQLGVGCSCGYLGSFTNTYCYNKQDYLNELFLRIKT
jgi:hypothetical protein